MVKKVKQDPLDPQTISENDVARKKEDDPGVKLEAKEKEAAENYDKYLRVLADIENIKKRAAKEKTEAIKYGNEKLIKDILPMLDNLERALKHADNSGDFEAFKQGLKLVQDQFTGCLKKHGLERIDCVDKTFDPNVHEALFQIESDAHGDNKVVDELEKGYLLNGRLLRPAKVSVCKKGRGTECQQNSDDKDTKEEK
jgi:molecular chaperone GrpE